MSLQPDISLRLLARAVFHRLPGGFQNAVRTRLAARHKERARRLLQRRFLRAGLPAFEQPNFNELLHHLRGRGLDGLPRGVANFVSVGCAGTWYFNWIEEHCGPIGKHVGIEFYSPRPHDLPPNVEWITNTAGDMKDIASASADVLFSGQNIEHMWIDDIANFLLESHRVLKPGGVLAIDSPNRTVTRLRNWSHPEHTIEFTPEEIYTLLDLAGFDVDMVRGMWLCMDKGGKSVGVDDLDPGPDWTIHRRITEAAADPGHAFCWWVQAVRGVGKPDEVMLRARIREIFIDNWPERVSRTITHVGSTVLPGEFTAVDREGLLMSGPCMPLPAGRYTVTMEMGLGDDVERYLEVADCDVVGAGKVLARRRVMLADFARRRAEVSMDFALDAMTFGMEFRVVAGPGALCPEEEKLHVKRAVQIVSHDDPLYSTAR